MRFDEQLRILLSHNGFDENDRQPVARHAHALTSQAALLGFLELAECCTLLEQACLSGGDFSHALESVRRAAEDARGDMIGMRAMVA